MSLLLTPSSMVLKLSKPSLVGLWGAAPNKLCLCASNKGISLEMIPELTSGRLMT